jgi:hypothetical protein
VPARRLGLTSRALCRTLAALAAAGASVALAGCATGPPPPASQQELSYAETFPFFKLYWVGREFAHAPVTAVDGLASYDPATGETVYYGDCKLHGGLLGGSLLGEGECELPLRITSVIYVPRSNAPLGAQRNTLIRGVPAVIYERGTAIELYTGHLAIEIRAEGSAQAMLAAQLMRPLNAPGTAGERLPLPTYCPGLVGPTGRRLATVLAHLPDQACKRREAAEAEAQAERSRGASRSQRRPRAGAGAGGQVRRALPRTRSSR